MDRYQNTFDTWNKLASMYQDKFMDMDLYNDTYDVFCDLVQKRGASVFEIGCGPGNITRYLLARRPDFRIEATDVAPGMVELAQKNNPTAHCSIMDCREIDQLTTFFDAIMCGFCLPYLSREDCTKLIKDCSALLHSDGVLYLSAIEDDYQKSAYETSSNGEHTMFVYYHQADYLLQALEENNFDTPQVIRKHYPKGEGASATHIIFIAVKK